MGKGHGAWPLSWAESAIFLFSALSTPPPPPPMYILSVASLLIILHNHVFFSSSHFLYSLFCFPPSFPFPPLFSHLHSISRFLLFLFPLPCSPLLFSRFLTICLFLAIFPFAYSALLAGFSCPCFLISHFLSPWSSGLALSLFTHFCSPHFPFLDSFFISSPCYLSSPFLVSSSSLRLLPFFLMLICFAVLSTCLFIVFLL